MGWEGGWGAQGILSRPSFPLTPLCPHSLWHEYEL